MADEASIWKPGSVPLAAVDGAVAKQSFTNILAPQSLFNLTAFAYAVGTNSLAVYKNGLRLIPEVDYVESSTSSFTLTVAAVPGDKVYAEGLVNISGTIVTGDGKLYVSGSDTIAGFLASKFGLAIGSAGSLSIANGAGGQVLVLTIPVGVAADGSVAMTGELQLVDGSFAASLSDVSNAIAAAMTGISAINSGVKQTIQAAPLDSNGINSSLQAVGLGSLQVKLDVTSEPLVVSYSNGATETAETISANVANLLGTLATWSKYYVTKLLGGVWGITKKAPQYGQSFQRGAASLVHFDGANLAVATPDAYGNVWSFIGAAALDTSQFKYGSASLKLNGTNSAVRSTGISKLSDDGWTIEQWVRFNVLPTAGQNQAIFAATGTGDFGAYAMLNNTGGTLKSSLNLSSNNSSNDIANASLGTKTSWTTGLWYHIVVEFNSVQGTYKLYVDGVLDTAVTSAVPVNAIAKIDIGQRAATNFLNGWVDEFEYVPYTRYNVAFIPPLAPKTVEGNFFSIPKMRMYTISGENTNSAGGDPAITQVSRLYLGEVLTNATDVSNIINYAVQGKYNFSQASLVISTVYSFNHNIGASDIVVTSYLENKVAENGYVPGERVYNPGDGNSGTGSIYYGFVTRYTKLQVKVATGNGGLGVVNANGTPSAFGSANWSLGGTVRRAF